MSKLHISQPFLYHRIPVHTFSGLSAFSAFSVVSSDSALVAFFSVASVALTASFRAAAALPCTEHTKPVSIQVLRKAKHHMP
jgi:hypothetical protein